ncbi:hypothetical protein N7468_004365 [Penicillium chermesinum]|uniref:Grh/CP2 DB domain-containing protein n=1 Tax=Penicillium chermesinum TaxID=63820 RepID=A0A9W9P867_9EURO|nr:uncharacterized protein N7468_004365 [Penicillium chermesinum]KAJ5239746.1 hypothetical protein N7468_004365 [Penicillium chermesinum]
MFRNRNNTQKPDDDFISRFQKTFSDVVPRRDSDGNPVDSPAYDAREGNMAHGPFHLQSHEIKMEDANLKFPQDRTPRNLHDLDFSPSWMDPHGNMNMMSLAAQHPGFYTPNSAGMGTIFHSQAGDLTLPHSGINTFNQPYLAEQMPDMTNPFMQQASYAPSAFIQQEPESFDMMDDSVDGSSIDGLADQSSNVSRMSIDPSVSHPPYAQGENFRYNVSLRAPTAMVRHKREVPVSYLNKGQAYNLTVVDSTPPMVSTEPIQYRTFVRVSFEEEEQRQKPAACWQLWKEGRGMNEAHHRGGKLLAVEYVDPAPQAADENKPRQIQIEQMSFDGFCVTWTVNPTNGASECTIPVRFNFLSTDFSHSKGVKGIPVRLCAKTELLVPGEEVGTSREAEVCYCKVKLFRDHGAERKLSNDVAHVKKSIEKLKQQISQAEMGGGFGKRKRGSNSTASVKSDRSKQSKHKRSYSICSEDGDKMSLEDDLQAKLAMMQDMFSSTQNMSILALRGDEEDDPDLYPVRLPEGEYKPDTFASQSLESLISPTTSNPSTSSFSSRMRSSKGKPSTVPRLSSGDRVSQGFIEAVDIDPTYRPLRSDLLSRVIACFYVRFQGNEQHPEDYYRAIYLTERTVRDLMKKISEKHHIDPQRIVRILHVNEDGLRIMVDDDVVRELPEGQDMVADIYESSENGNSGAPMEIKLTY